MHFYVIIALFACPGNSLEGRKYAFLHYSTFGPTQHWHPQPGPVILLPAPEIQTAQDSPRQHQTAQDSPRQLQIDPDSPRQPQTAPNSPKQFHIPPDSTRQHQRAPNSPRQPQTAPGRPSHRQSKTVSDSFRHL